MHTQVHRRIIADADVLAGRPCIEGTSIPAGVLIAQVAAGRTLDNVAREFQIDVDAVRAALEYGAACASQPPALDDALLALAGVLAGSDAPSPPQASVDSHVEQ